MVRALAFLAVLSLARPAAADDAIAPVVVCPEAAASAATIDRVVHEALAREAANTELLGQWEFSFAPCSTTGGSLVARSGDYVIARRVPFVPGTSVLSIIALERGAATIVRHILLLRGGPASVVGERSSDLAAPAASAPVVATSSASRSVAAPERTPSSSVAAFEAEPSYAPEDPRSERFSVALDGGLRFYQGSTGAYALRLRIALKWVFFDYRFATISVAGIFVGDTARIIEQTYGIGFRWRRLLGRRSTISLGPAFYLGVASGRGDSSVNAGFSFLTGCFDARLDAVYEFGFRAFRLRFGMDIGLARSAVLLAQGADGSPHRIGGFDGFELGLYVGVGLARLRGSNGR